MIRLLAPWILISFLVMPAATWAADKTNSISQYKLDPMPYFQQVGQELQLSGEIPVAELPTPPVVIKKTAPNEAVMIEHDGKAIWFNPVDITTTVTRKAEGCKTSVSKPEALKTYSEHGIGETE